MKGQLIVYVRNEHGHAQVYVARAGTTEPPRLFAELFTSMHELEVGKALGVLLGPVVVPDWPIVWTGYPVTAAQLPPDATAVIGPLQRILKSRLAQRFMMKA